MGRAECLMLATAAHLVLRATLTRANAAAVHVRKPIEIQNELPDVSENLFEENDIDHRELKAAKKRAKERQSKPQNEPQPEVGFQHGGGYDPYDPYYYQPPHDRYYKPDPYHKPNYYPHPAPKHDPYYKPKPTPGYTPHDPYYKAHDPYNKPTPNYGYKPPDPYNMPTPGYKPHDPYHKKPPPYGHKPYPPEPHCVPKHKECCPKYDRLCAIFDDVTPITTPATECPNTDCFCPHYVEKYGGYGMHHENAGEEGLVEERSEEVGYDSHEKSELYCIPSFSSYCNQFHCQDGNNDCMEVVQKCCPGWCYSCYSQDSKCDAYIATGGLLADPQCSVFRSMICPKENSAAWDFACTDPTAFCTSYLTDKKDGTVPLPESACFLGCLRAFVPVDNANSCCGCPA